MNVEDNRGLVRRQGSHGNSMEGLWTTWSAEGENAMAGAIDVAAYILAQRGPMTAMKLQKLVYYSQAWHLVWEEEPLQRPYRGVGERSRGAEVVPGASSAMGTQGR